MTDLILLALYVMLMGTIKTKDSILAVLSFGLSVAYTHSPLFDSHPAFANHLLVSLCFIPAIIFSTKIVCIPLICYAMFQWLTSGEYLFFDTTEILIGSFKEIATALNLLIMAAILYDRHNYNYHKHNVLDDSWIINLCHHIKQNSRDSKKRKSQC